MQDVIGSAGQGLLLCALASERGVDDVGTRVRLLGSVLFGRDIDPALAGTGDDAGDEETAGHLVGKAVAIAAEPLRGARLELAATAMLLWRQGEMFTAISEELGKRPQARAHHKVLRKLPVVGMAGSYLGELDALKLCAEKGTGWIAAAQG